MRRTTGWLLRGGVLLAVGVGAYYGLEVADKVLMRRLAGDAARGAIPLIELPTAAEGPPQPRQTPSSEGPGNPLVRRALAGLEARRSVAVRIDQSGWIDGQAVKTSGRYCQQGSDGELQFFFEQLGQMAGYPTRLLRVSDSRFLWTDLSWGDPSVPNQSIARIDLRKVRRALTRAEEETGGLAADPSSWSRFGGLPMLLAGLDENFTFGPPYLMQLHDDRVAALVGRWRPERLTELMGAEQGRLPARAPQHVVIALEEASLFPLLIEYRQAQDPLSAPGLQDRVLLTSSGRPLLKMELDAPVFNEKLDPRLFGYNPAGDNWADQTDRELRLAQPQDGIRR